MNERPSTPLPPADKVSAPSLRGRTALVTGGTRGIGLAVARGLAVRGARVIVTGRDRGAGAQALGLLRASTAASAAAGAEVDYLPVDGCEQASVRELAASVRARCERLDLLIHNAAFVADAWRTTSDGVESQFAANHLAVMLLSWELLPLLRASAPARIIITASQVERGASADFAKLAGDGPPSIYVPAEVYAQTKLANMLFSRSLARQLDGSGITVNALHPGVVRTALLDTLERRPHDSAASGLARLAGMAGRWLRIVGLRAPPRDWAIDTTAGAQTTLVLATAPELAHRNGGYFVDAAPAVPSANSLDDTLAASLWELSARCLAIPRDWTDRVTGGNA